MSVNFDFFYLPKHYFFWTSERTWVHNFFQTHHVDKSAMFAIGIHADVPSAMFAVGLHTNQRIKHMSENIFIFN